MAGKFAATTRNSIPVHFVTRAEWKQKRTALPLATTEFAAVGGFDGQAGQHLFAPGEKPNQPVVLFGVENADAPFRNPFLAGKLVYALPEGTYRLAPENGLEGRDLENACLGWLLSSYAFSRYREQSRAAPQLVAPAGVDKARIERLVAAVFMGRDLINTPANDMGTGELSAAALSVAKKYKAKSRTIRGEQLLKQNFPLIHAVGRAGPQPPCLVDVRWGRAGAPKVTLVGKGVCFDTGGLDIKPASAMLMMKKDMGGAATALALAQMIMDGGLDVQLRLLLPIVENSVGSASFRPGDVITARNGVRVEIGNTDAEGRLILADALALGAEEEPDLMMDFATLTGAARVATGPELPPFYCTSDAVAGEIAKHSGTAFDPVWRLPLWPPYEAMLASPVADTNNVSKGPFAGSITAALFLRKFVDGAKVWAHFDVYGWSQSARPGAPEGGDIQAARMLYDMLEARYGTGKPAAARRRK